MTSKGKLAVAAMIDLALTSCGEPVSLAGISFRQKISLSYLEQLFSKLRRNGLVRSIRGAGGGYVLARDSAAITLADIIAAVDDVTDSTPDDVQDFIPAGSARCDTTGLWHDVGVKMNELLDSISLRMLVEDQPTNGVSVKNSPVRRGISHAPVVKPIRTDTPNSVFALGAAFLERQKVA
jgi:Rrf2 family iron-sulfur cluster assembly transcriptional regulator